MPDRIVFTGDVLRPQARSTLRPLQGENIDWLARVLRQPVTMAADCPQETVRWDDDWLHCARLDTGAVTAIYRAFGQVPGLTGWARIFSAERLPEAVEHLFERLFSNSLVIGFELPPYLVDFCNRRAIPFIDLTISPLRFMDDLMFQMSSNDAEVTEALKPHRVSKDQIRLAAGIVSSSGAKANFQPPRPGTLLVVLQTSFDRSVIDKGRFVTLLDHVDALRELAGRYRDVLIRSHPLEPAPELSDRVLEALPGARMTQDNFYHLLSHNNLAGVAALSSSCVAEARRFGREGHYLIPGFDETSLTPGIEGITVGEDLLTPDFWRDLLSAAGLAASGKDGLRVPFRANRLREQLRSSWGYSALDGSLKSG
ncbi:MAG: hypothetical protein AAF674_22795 [Pseudomonadota bacterium]